MSDSKEHLSNAALAGVRILVVDDEADVRDTLAAFLSTFGADVTTATGGDEAFAAFVERVPDVVISDVQMPDGNGLDLVRRIRALPLKAGGVTPAIALSGVSNADEALDAGFHVHLSKTTPVKVLLDTVHSFARAAEPRFDSKR